MEVPTINLGEVFYAAAKNYAKTVLGSEEPTTDFNMLMEAFVNGAKWSILEFEYVEEEDE